MTTTRLKVALAMTSAATIFGCMSALIHHVLAA